jgi:hypothetical protein
MKLVISTNSDGCAKVSPTDRRTLALEFPNKRWDDKPYWDGLYKWYYEEGGINKVLFFLKERKLGNFKPYPRPITKLLQRMQDKSLSDEAKALLEMLDSGYLPISYQITAGGKPVKVRRLSTKDFREHFQDGYPGIQKISDNFIGDLLKGIGCTKKKTKAGNLWELPPLEDCRKAWDQKRNSNREWDTDIKIWGDSEDIDANERMKQNKDSTVTTIGDSQSAKLEGGAALAEGSEKQQQDGSGKDGNHDTQESSDMANSEDIEVGF